jgi:hypothetical protein
MFMPAQALSLVPAKSLKKKLTVLTYAQTQNKKYESVIDDYVNIPDRVNALIAKRPELLAIFKELAQEFLDRFPFKTYDEMTKSMVGLGKQGYEPILDTDINITMQRDADSDWLAKLMGNFDPILVNAIRAYRDPARTDGGASRLIAWDGQHTVILLYLIAVYGFGCDPKDVKVPVSEYPGHDRASIRRQFVYYNSGMGSKKLGAIDMYMQYVYGYNHDGAREEMHIRCHEIQALAEKYGLFLTDEEKFGNQNEDGAVSRLSEIMSDSYSVAVIDKVFYYHTAAKKKESKARPMYALEMDNLSHYFKACEDQSIMIDYAYIDGMVDVLSKVTDNTWHVGSKKHKMVITAYGNWFKAAQAKGTILSDEKPRCNQTEVAPVWLCQVLVRHAKATVPTFTQSFKFAAKDLG